MAALHSDQFAAEAFTIVVVDDEVLIRMLSADALREEGYTVLEASSGDEAMALLDAGIHADMLLTDVRMPGRLDGIALANAVRMSFPTLPIIVSSGHVVAPGAVSEGVVDAYLPKPFTLSRLLDTVRELLDDR